jgi:hypothetical protein
MLLGALDLYDQPMSCTHDDSSALHSLMDLSTQTLPSAAAAAKPPAPFLPIPGE